ncbi:MAG: DNA polymerase I [Candidatus Omnitrophica bacterium]|nr:DNA polymerase I [Candidatus Omnitrophota bacterium]MBU1869888.1 DNA polymerase I [Candidatus Omnitrophota bacterium]
MVEKRLYLIDATAFCYRAFYGLRGLSTSFGQPTNAVYGFVNMLNKLLRDNNPEYLAVCFDVSRDTFRLKKFAEYKIQRPPMPDGLSSQIPFIKEIVSAYGIKIVEKQGFEADDILATLAKRSKAKKIQVTIVSSDKDILQLVDDNTTVFSPYKDEGTSYDTQKVLERFGVGPQGITDIIALMGDDVDNIPGAPGIGEKTASGLLQEFGSLKNLIANIDKIKSEKTRRIVSENLDSIKLSKELAELRADVELDLDFSDLKIRARDSKELFRIFKQLEFNKFIKELPKETDNSAKVNIKTVKDADLKDFVSDEGVFLCGSSFSDLAFCVKNEFFRVDGPGNNLKELLASDKIKKIGHDLKDIKVLLAKEDVRLEGLYFDTMIAAYLLNPSKSDYSIGNVALDYLGNAVGEVSDAGQVLDLTLSLKPKLESELTNKGLTNLFFETEMPLVEVLSEMETSGIKIDLQLLKKLSHDLEKRLKKLIEEIYELSGAQFNINSPKQLREILFDKLKLPVIRRTKTGPSTDEEVLRALSDRHKLPKFLLEYRQLTKLKNTYVDALPELVDKKTGRIHTSFNQTGTETGRLSSSNPNLQNIPIKTDIGKNIRRAIIASSKESLLVACDYSQIELRVLAHLSKDENLIQAFMQGKDIHKITAALIFNVPEKDVTGEMRDVAKRVNFGIVYGLTGFGLSRDLGISVDEAQGFIDAYFARYPKVKTYIEEQAKRAQKDGFVTTLLGRRRYIPEINNKNQGIRQFAERQAVNTPIQGSASDLIKLAMIDIQRLLNEKKLRSKMILQIHDELVFDVLHKELTEVVELVRERMENVLKLVVPVEVDIRKGKNWLETEEVQ